MQRQAGWSAGSWTPGRSNLAQLARLARLARLTGLALAPLVLGCSSAAPGVEAQNAAGRITDARRSLGSFEVASIGAPPGTIDPATCVAGDHELYLGADLIDPGSHLVVRLVIDPLDGPAIRVYDVDAPFDRTVLFFRDECSTFKMDLDPTGSIVNNIVVRRLALEVDCENEEGATIRGSAIAESCD